MKRFLPDTIFARLFLMVLLAIVISHMMTFVLLLAFFGERQHRPLPGERRPQVVAPGDPAQAAPAPRARPFRRPPDMIIAGYAVRTPPPGFWISMASQLFALTVAALFAARMLARPIQRLGQAAAELGADLNRPPIAETGTAEARQAARVFNQMQQRIRQHIAERERFLAAVSHDLRTPLTRIRLRAESADAAPLRDGLLRDVTEMQTLIEATLSYLSGEHAAEPLTLLDVSDLLHSLADDQADAGHPVQVEAQAQPFLGQPMALRRCVDNLVSNAVRYGGGHVALRCRDDGTQLVIEVQDNGPGLPDPELARVTEPFYRVEASRHKARGGVGLGLSIALNVARRHGGTLVLTNVPTGGLLATLRLPRGVPGA